MISRLNSNNFISVVKLKNICTYYTIRVKFLFCTFQTQHFKLLQIFENATFPLMSMIKLSKNCHKNLANCLNIINENKIKITLFILPKPE